MTTEEKITRVTTLIGSEVEAADDLISVYLEDARDEILRVRYPFGIPETVSDVPAMYETMQCNLAARYILRRGGEGEQVHNEDGVHRHYGSVDDRDILEKIVPVVKII